MAKKGKGKTKSELLQRVGELEHINSILNDQVGSLRGKIFTINLLVNRSNIFNRTSTVLKIKKLLNG